MGGTNVHITLPGGKHGLHHKKGDKSAPRRCVPYRVRVDPPGATRTLYRLRGVGTRAVVARHVTVREAPCTIPVSRTHTRLHARARITIQIHGLLWTLAR